MECMVWVRDLLPHNYKHFVDCMCAVDMNSWVMYVAKASICATPAAEAVAAAACGCC